MPNDPIPAPPAPPDPIPPGKLGAVALLLRFISTLNNERLLLLVVVLGFGYTTFYHLKTQTDRELFAQRTYEEARATDRNHCDAREDSLRAFFANQADLQRRHDALREDRITQKFGDAIEKLNQALAALVTRLNNLEMILKKP